MRSQRRFWNVELTLFFKIAISAGKCILRGLVMRFLRGAPLELFPHCGDWNFRTKLKKEDSLPLELFPHCGDWNSPSVSPPDGLLTFRIISPLRGHQDTASLLDKSRYLCVNSASHYLRPPMRGQQNTVRLLHKNKYRCENSAPHYFCPLMRGQKTYMTSKNYFSTRQSSSFLSADAG